MALFDGDAWLGGYYELAIELGARSDQRLLTALESVWSCPGIDGCYLQHDVEPADQPRLPARLPDDCGSLLYGVATLPIGIVVPCCTVVVREEAGVDWLDFGLPLGGLGKAVPEVGGYPFDGRSSRSWSEPIDEWLAGIGQSLFDRVPFRLGLLGFEVSGIDDATNLLANGPPQDRWIGYLLPRDRGLTYLPCERW